MSAEREEFIYHSLVNSVFSDFHIHLIGVCPLNQSTSAKHNEKEKPAYLCTPRECLKKCVIIGSHYFDYGISFSHALCLCLCLPLFSLCLSLSLSVSLSLCLSLRDLSFALCSHDHDVLHADRIIGFLILITHKSTRS